VLTTQSIAAVVFPIGGGSETQEQYIVELNSISYFYRLSIYDSNHILLDRKINFTQGNDLDAFILEGENGELKVMVVMTLDDSTDSYDVFSFDGTFLSTGS